MNRARHLLQSSILVILFLGLGKLTGLVRLRLVAQVFGTTPANDAFQAANQLPELFFTLIAGGSLAAAFIPVYSGYLTDKSRRKSAQLANTILTLVILILGAVCALGAIIAPWLTRTLLVPNFTPDQQVLTANIMRIILVQTTLFGVSGVLSSILNAHQHFALPALAPLALDVGYVTGLYLFVPQLGIIGLAWGTVIGGILHIAIQTPALIKHRIRLRLDWQITLPGVHEIIRLMGPRIVTLGAVQAADLVIINLSSALPSGSTTGYFYGYALMQLPETLFGTAIALVMFPTMAELFNAGDIEGLKRTAVNTLSIIWTLAIPAAALLVLLGRPAITFFLEGNAFDARSTQLVYSVLIVFSVRVVSEATLEVVARLFYAQHDTRTPMFAYLGWLLINSALALLLVDSLGVIGLALASTVAFTILAAVLFALNQQRLGSLLPRQLFNSAGRALLATVGMTAVVLLLGNVIGRQLLFLATAGISSVLTYIVLNLLLGGQEIPSLFRLIRSRAV